MTLCWYLFCWWQGLSFFLNPEDGGDAYFSKILVFIYQSAQCDFLDNMTFTSTALRTCSLKFYGAEDTLIS